MPLFAGETPPGESQVLEGGLLCNETISSLNGLGGPILQLLAGQGFTITPRPSEHKVVIAMDASNMAVCFADSLNESISAIYVPPDSGNPNDCGPA